MLNEDDYFISSDYYQLSTSKDEENYISFKVEAESYFRMFMERLDLKITLKDVTNSKDIVSGDSSLYAKLQAGTYRVELAHYTDYAQKVSDAVGSFVWMTISIAKSSYLTNTYLPYHRKKMDTCEENTHNWPLALERGKESDDWNSIYNYPLLRVSSKTLNTQFVIDSYTFRVNETSRFYGVVGMHFIANWVTLALSDLKGVSNVHLGRQVGNENIIDVIVPPGDYGLVVQQSTMTTLKGNDAFKACGLFSFHLAIAKMQAEA